MSYSAYKLSDINQDFNKHEVESKGTPSSVPYEITSRWSFSTYLGNLAVIIYLTSISISSMT